MTADLRRVPAGVRRAVAGDRDLLARIWREGWVDGHRGRVPEVLVAGRTAESFDQRVAERLDRTWVAEVDGTVAGFVTVVEDEVEQLYVDRDRRGSGVAAVLLRHAETMIGRAGWPTAWLAVVPGNDRARRFYAKQGWQDRGADVYPAQTESGPVPVPVRRYELELGPDRRPGAGRRPALSSGQPVSRSQPSLADGVAELVVGLHGVETAGRRDPGTAPSGGPPMNPPIGTWSGRTDPTWDWEAVHGPV